MCFFPDQKSILLEAKEDIEVFKIVLRDKRSYSSYYVPGFKYSKEITPTNLHQFFIKENLGRTSIWCFDEGVIHSFLTLETAKAHYKERLMTMDNNIEIRSYFIPKGAYYMTNNLKEAISSKLVDIN